MDEICCRVFRSRRRTSSGPFVCLSSGSFLLLTPTVTSQAGVTWATGVSAHSHTHTLTNYSSHDSVGDVNRKCNVATFPRILCILLFFSTSETKSPDSIALCWQEVRSHDSSDSPGFNDRLPTIHCNTHVSL